MDVDGVLTDGSLLIAENGEQLRTMNIKDGYAIQHAIKNGFEVCIISGSTSEGVRLRLEGLGVKNIYMNCHDKKKQLLKWLTANRIETNQVLFIGDDIPDREVMSVVGLLCCPSDAVAEIKSVSKYIAAQKGGEGCVREIIEKVLKQQGKW